MARSVARIIAAVVAIGVVCCAGALIVAVHLPDGDTRPEIGNVTPEGSPTESNLPGNISRNETPNEGSEEVPEVRNMTSKEILERAQEIQASWYRSSTVERVLKEANMTPEELPGDVTEELKNTVQFEDIIRTWEFDSQNKQVVIYASPALNEEHEKELSVVQGRRVGDWTFTIIWEPYVPSFVRRALDAANMTLDELPDEVKEEMGKTVQIGGVRKWELDPQNNRVIVYTYFSRDAEHEQEVQAVQGREVAGWTFNVVQEQYVPAAVRRALKEANMTPDELPDEVKEEMENIARFVEIGGIRKWELDPLNKQATIYVYSIPEKNDVDAVQGKQVAGWTFTVIHDLEYEKERERVVAELLQFQKDHPELQISSFAVSPTEIWVWVRNLTPETEALNGTTMHNRTVLIDWNIIDYALRVAREEAGWM
ncbi:hypothetical protein R6Y95_02695 [Methanoculleus palmolei]|jgi:hypothetical protein|uniref:Uncharacterized protein n=1 Tax=Methanoculleus palmolei TaxID=72612 RepID=A0ABD8A9P8_9EURY|nr:hypothetical protein R6Y95_02695 [Methanoculleus palmolei]